MLPTEVTPGSNPPSPGASHSTIIMAREKLRLLVAIRDLLDRVVHDAKLNLLRVEDEHYASAGRIEATAQTSACGVTRAGEGFAASNGASGYTDEDTRR